MTTTRRATGHHRSALPLPGTRTVAGAARRRSHGSLEARIVQHLTAGTRLDCLPGTAAGVAVTEEDMLGWDDSQILSADFLRKLLRGLVVPKPDPHGLRIRGVRVSGRVDLEDLTTEIGIVLIDCYLDQGLTSRDARLPVLGLIGCHARHETTAVIDATRLVTTGPCALVRTCVRASWEGPAVQFSGASIGGQLNLSGSTIHNASGLALALDGAAVAGDVILREDFSAVSAGGQATIRARDAHVAGQFDCTGSELVNVSGPVLDGESLDVDEDLFLRSLQGTAECGGAGIKLSGASVGGQLDCSGMQAVNWTGSALDAKNLTVASDMLLRRDVRLTGAGPNPTVRLDDTRVTGIFDCSGARILHAGGRRNSWSVDGLTYSGVPLGKSCGGWLALLRDATPQYAAQPYQQFAGAHKAMGQESDVRRVLMAQRAVQLASGGADRKSRMWGAITRATLGYGYQPWKALVWLLVTLAVSVAASVVLGAHGALTRVDEQVAGQPCSVLEQIAVGLDSGLPLIKTGARDRCDLTTDASSVTGIVLTVVTWLVQLAAWAFAALFVAGFTGAVRKN